VTVGGVRSALFGGEGLFFARLTGPGKVWIQSLPFSRLAGRMVAAAMPGVAKTAAKGRFWGRWGFHRRGPMMKSPLRFAWGPLPIGMGRVQEGEKFRTVRAG
jgi:hypothetical protein